MKRQVPRLSGEAKRIAKGELIGLTAKVSTSSDKALEGLQGDVVDETLHTLTIRTGGPGGRRFQVPKAGNVFAFHDIRTGAWVDVEGRAIVYRSWDRTKKVR